jgi:hypothetical protein
MAKKKLDRTLPQQPKSPKPAFQMQEPNDDMAAFGWDLGKIRFPAKGLKRGDVWPGPPVFSVPIKIEILNQYGPDICFLQAKFIQLCLDASPEVRDATLKAKAARYSKAAIGELRETIMRVFKTKIMPDILKRFENISDGVAEFYAARLAHYDKFGADDEEAVK